MSDEAHRRVGSSSQTVGPFFHFGIAANEALGRLAGPDVPGERIRLRVTVVDGDGAPVPDALVELWQADAAGRYPEPPAGTLSPAVCRGFGRLPTGEDGSCLFETIRPGRVSDGQRGWQAPHVNVCLLARGLLRQVHTRIYFAGDLAGDPVLALVPVERRETLLARPGDAASDPWQFEIRLQGPGETVFFDI